jgi:hypothetical protein
MRQKNDLILRAFERHFQEATRLIHFGVVAPILENALFVLALFRKKEQKTMLEGKELLLRLIAYQSNSGLFPDAIHLLDHNQFSWKKNLYLAAVFHLLVKEFDRVIDKVSKERIHHSYSLLLNGLKKLELEGALLFLRSVLLDETPNSLPRLDSQEEVEILFVAYGLALPQLRLQMEEMLSFYVLKDAPFYQGPFAGIKQYKGAPLKSIIEISLTHEEELKEEEAIFDKVWMESVLAPDLSHIKGQAFWVRHKDLKEKGDLYARAFFDLKQGLSAALYVPQNTFFDPKTSIYTFSLEGFYEEDAHEISLYIPKCPSIGVYVDEAKSSIFRENEQITIKTKSHSIPLMFRVVEGEGKFIGHISLDSRPYEIEKGGIYDRKISIRTVERSMRCRLELFIGWNDKASPF